MLTSSFLVVTALALTAPVARSGSLVCFHAQESGSDRITEKVGETPYFPNKVGTTWTYRLGNGSMVQRVARHERLGDHMCAVMETIVGGNVVAMEHLAVTKEGVFRLAINGKKSSKPVMILKLNAKAGDSWKVEAGVAGETVNGMFTRGEEDVDLPGYKGKTITSRGDFDINGKKGSFGYWFAEGKGVVKQHINLNDKDIISELVKFEEPGRIAAARDVGDGLKMEGKLDAQTKKLFYGVKLAEGKTYVIDMTSPDAKALDPFLFLLDAAGKELARDDDGGGFPNARIVFRAPSTGTYQIVAGSYQEKGNGQFTLTIREKE